MIEMGRSAKVTRTVGLREIKRSAKGIDKPSKMAARRRREKSYKIKEAIDREADKRRADREVCLPHPCVCTA